MPARMLALFFAVLPIGIPAPPIFAQSEDDEFFEFKIVVTAPSAAVKAGPKVLRQVPRGTKFLVFAKQGEWYKVKLPGAEQRGWIHKSLVGEQQFSVAQKLRGQEMLDLYKAAMASADKEQWPEAIDRYRRLVALADQVFGPRDIDAAYFRYSLAIALCQSDKLKAAEKHFRHALEVYRELRGRTDVKTLDALYMTAILIDELERYDESIPMWRELAGHYESQKKTDDAGDAYFSLGFALRMKDDEINAREALEQALKLLKQSTDWGKDSIPYCLRQLGYTWFNEEEYQRALSVFREAREGLSVQEEVDDEVAAELDALIGSCLRFVGQPDEAERMLVAATERLRELHTEPHEDTRFAAAETGYLLCDLGRKRESRPWFEEALVIARKLYGDEDEEVTDMLWQLGDVLSAAGDSPRALEYRKDVLQREQKKFGEDDLQTGYAHHVLANAYVAIGDLETAETHFRSAIQIYERQSPPSTESIGGAQLDLSTIYRLNKDFDRAQQEIENALKNLQVDPDDEDFEANALAALSYVLGRRGQHDAAVKHAREALHIYERVFGEGHPYVAHMKETLAIATFEKGDYEGSRRLFDDVVREFIDAWGDSDPDTAQAHLNLAEALAKLGRTREASREIEKSRRASRRHLSRILPSLTPEAQVRYLKLWDEEALSVALSFSVRYSQESRVPEMSAGWLLNGKAVAQEALAEGALFAKQENADLVKRLRVVRSQLSQLSLQTRSPTERSNRDRAEQLQRRIAALETEQQTLIRKLGAAGAGLADDPWISLGRLRDDLPYETAFVNIARVRRYDFDSEVDTPEDRWGEPHYAAWLIPASGEGNVRIIDLGPADRIDQQVSEVRKKIDQSATAILSIGELKATEQLRPSLEALSQLIVDPIIRRLDGTKKLILSPDGALWLVPWAALPTKDAEFLIEQFDIGYAVSGRELIRQNVRRSTNAAVIMADPDYDMASGATGTQKQLPRVERLPGTAIEAQSVRPSLTAYLNAEPEVLLRTAATESKFKELFRPQVLMMSTHGFFLKDKQTAAQNDRYTRSMRTLRSVTPTTAPKITSPLLRCGLLLAGCNSGGDLGPKDSADDGVLTGLEIIGTDLRGTELVVLSACETGVGEVRNGEGVAGLRQAFQLAGAKSVVATLWQIPDRETARLITQFFGNLAADHTSSSALRNAQLARIRARRERQGAAHPFYWSAFTITGSN